jgi:Icc-related predicted phosphoesterase
LRIKVIADVHGDLEAVRREAAECDVLLLLGDLINVIDYENAGGILGEVYGSEAVREWSVFRAQGKFDESRAVLRAAARGREQEVRAIFAAKIDQAHESFCEAVPSNTVVTFGNVDVPDLVRKYLPDDVRFVDGEVLELDGILFGFIGGGLPKVGIPGEVPLVEFDRKVNALERVDVLCAHVPPAIEDLTFDVVAQFNEPGSESLLEYIREHQPTHVYFGHVHQPRVARTTVGSSRLVNVGSHFRSTGRALDHPVDDVV